MWVLISTIPKKWCFLFERQRLLRSKKFGNAELQALLDENSAQTLKELTEALNFGKLTVSDCLHTIRKIKKEIDSTSIVWIGYSKLFNFALHCTSLLVTKRSILHQITGDEKWICYDKKKRKKSWIGLDRWLRLQNAIKADLLQLLFEFVIYPLALFKICLLKHRK